SLRADLTARGQSATRSEERRRSLENEVSDLRKKLKEIEKTVSEATEGATTATKEKEIAARRAEDLAQRLEAMKEELEEAKEAVAIHEVERSTEQARQKREIVAINAAHERDWANAQLEQVEKLSDRDRQHGEALDEALAARDAAHDQDVAEKTRMHNQELEAA